MQPVRRAVIDIGTNSVKLLVADVAGYEVHPVFEESHQSRLGQGFYATHRLQPGPITRTAEAVAEFTRKAHQCGAGALRIIATSAAREAVNRLELTEAVERACGHAVQIISGEQEADWVYRGVCTDPQLAGASLLLLDVGGGSTELIVGHAGCMDLRRSYQLGSVRLLERLQPSDPPLPTELARCRVQLRTFLQAEVHPALAPVLGGHKLLLVGTGGTASILGCMEARLVTFDRARLEATHLSRDRLTWHVEHLWRLPLEARKQIIGLPPNRADVILTGTAIYEAIAELFGLGELRVSTRGLRFAAVLEIGIPQRQST